MDLRKDLLEVAHLSDPFPTVLLKFSQGKMDGIGWDQHVCEGNTVGEVLELKRVEELVLGEF